MLVLTSQRKVVILFSGHPHGAVELCTLMHSAIQDFSYSGLRFDILDSE